MVLGGCSWLPSCCGWLFLVGSGCESVCGVFFFCSGMYYFVVVNILFYCDVYIILLC